MPRQGDRDACGRVYPHAKWGQDCGQRQGRAGGGSGGPGAQPTQPEPQSSPVATAPPPNEDQARLDRERAEQEAFLEEERQREREFRERERAEEQARLDEQRRQEQGFLDRERSEEQARLDEQRRQEQLFLDEGYAKERQFLEQDYLRQKQYIEQSAALSEQERQLALRELETQINFQRQQLELRRQQVESDLAEEKRQAPLRLRDIADQFASQGAFYSRGRADAQAEATHASGLVVQGLERQLKGEKLTAEELEAMASIKRGQFGIEAQKIALEMETSLKELQAGVEKGLWSADFAYRQSSWESDFGYRSATQQNNLAYDMGSWESDFGYRSGTQANQLDYDVGTWEGDFNYRTRAYELKTSYEEAKRRLEAAIADGLGGGEEGKILTKSDLGTMLRQGIIDRDQYTAGLVNQGYSQDQAKALYLSEMAKGPLTNKSGGAAGGGTKLSVTQLSTMMRQGLIDKKGYIKALKSKGYSGAEAKALYASEQAKGTGKGMIISKSDISSAVSEGLMTPEAGYKNLRTLGYDDYSARVIIANAEKNHMDSSAAAARRAASGSKGKSLSKDDWVSLYRNKMISEGELIAGLKSIDYTTAQAKALAANARAASERDSGSGSSGTSGDRTSVNGIEISYAKGQELNSWSGLGDWMARGKATFDAHRNALRDYYNKNRGRGTLAGWVSFYRSQLIAAGTPSGEASAWLAKNANSLSYMWYRSANEFSR